MIRPGAYRPRGKKRKQWSIQKISTWGPAGRPRRDWLSTSMYLGFQMSLWEAVAELLLWTAPHFFLQLGTGMECLLQAGGSGVFLSVQLLLLLAVVQ